MPDSNPLHDGAGSAKAGDVPYEVRWARMFIECARLEIGRGDHVTPHARSVVLSQLADAAVSLDGVIQSAAAAPEPEDTAPEPDDAISAVYRKLRYQHVFTALDEDARDDLVRWIAEAAVDAAAPWLVRPAAVSSEQDTRLRAFIDAADWYVKCLHDAWMQIPVRGMDEAHLGYEKAREAVLGDAGRATEETP